MPKINNMWTRAPKIKLYHNDQVAWPIGPDNDSYSIITYAYLNTDTNEVDNVECKLIKNWTSNRPQVLLEGTYKECYDLIAEIVEEIQS